MSTPPPVVAVLSSDWHADRRPWTRHPTAAGDSLYGIRQLVDLANRHRAVLVGAGDLIDVVDPDSQVLTDLIAALSDLTTPLLYVQGQHEGCTPPWLSLVPNSYHLHASSFRVCGPAGDVVFGGWDYCASVDAIADRLPECDVLVTHQVWAELAHNAATATGVIASLPARITRVLTGDYHVHLSRLVPRDGKPPVTVWSPGSTHCRSVSEPSDKYAFLLHADLSVSSVPLDCRPVRRFVVNTEEELERLVGTSDEVLFGPPRPGRPVNMAVPVLAVTVADTVFQSDRVLRGRFAACHLSVTVAKDERLAPVEARPITDPGLVVAECLDDIEKDPAVRDDVKFLLSVADPAAGLDQVCGRFDPAGKGGGL